VIKKKKKLSAFDEQSRKRRQAHERAIKTRGGTGYVSGGNRWRGGFAIGVSAGEPGGGESGSRVGSDTGRSGEQDEASFSDSASVRRGSEVFWGELRAGDH